MKFVALLLALSLSPRLHGAACFEGAEGPSTPWTMSGLWHEVDSSSVPCAGAHSGSHAFYFGIDSQCNYQNGQLKDGSLSSPWFTVTGAGDTNFSFWTKWQVESMNPSCYDQLWIEQQLTTTAGAWTLYAQVGPVSDPPSSAPQVGVASVTGLGGQAQWQFVQYDLSNFAGYAMQMRFRFLSSACMAPLCAGKTCGAPDFTYDNFLGWVVDDISYGCPSGTLTLAKSASPSYAARGDTVTYTLLAKNLDPSTRTLALWDTLPPGADFVSASTAPLQSGQLLSWNSLPPISSQATQAITVLVTVDAALAYPSDWMNTASGSSSAGGAAFTSAVAPVAIRDRTIQLSKSASPSSLASGDQVTFTIAVSDFTPLSLTSDVILWESYPLGFVETGVYPAYDLARQWRVRSLGSGETRYFSVWGYANGFNGQVLTNAVQATMNGAPQGSASASVTLHRPLLPQLSVKAVYPNPAPSGRAGLPQSAFIVTSANVALALTLDIYDVAGEKVRSIPYNAPSGISQVEWDLSNGSGSHVASGIYFGRLWVNDPLVGTVEAWAHIAVLR